MAETEEDEEEEDDEVIVEKADASPAREWRWRRCCLNGEGWKMYASSLFEPVSEDSNRAEGAPSGRICLTDRQGRPLLSG